MDPLQLVNVLTKSFLKQRSFEESEIFQIDRKLASAANLDPDDVVSHRTGPFSDVFLLSFEFIDFFIELLFLEFYEFLLLFNFLFEESKLINFDLAVIFYHRDVLI